MVLPGDSSVMGIKIKRIYDEAAKEDGFRFLVDRLWPRGLKKESAHIDCRLKEIAPSVELRQWCGIKGLSRRDHDKKESKFVSDLPPLPLY